MQTVFPAQQEFERDFETDSPVMQNALFLSLVLVSGTQWHWQNALKLHMLQACVEGTLVSLSVKCTCLYFLTCFEGKSWAFHDEHHTLKRSGVDHTVLPATNTMPALPRKRSPDGATTDWGGGHLIATYYLLFIDPKRMKGWVGLVGWPAADGLPT